MKSPPVCLYVVQTKVRWRFCKTLQPSQNICTSLKKHSVAKDCSGLSLFKQIVLVIKNVCKCSAFSHEFQKFFLYHQNIFFSQQVRTILIKKYHISSTLLTSITLGYSRSRKNCLLSSHSILIGKNNRNCSFDFIFTVTYYSSNKIRKTPNDHLIIFCQTLIGLCSFEFIGNFFQKLLELVISVRFMSSFVFRFSSVLATKLQKSAVMFKQRQYS